MRRRLPQLRKAAATAPSTYLGAVYFSDHLYLKPLLFVALTNDPTGLTITGTGVYSMGGTGTVAAQIGYKCTMVQRAVGAAMVCYVVVSMSQIELFSSHPCSKSTHPASIIWTCLAGSSRPGQPVTVRIVGTRNRTRQRHTHEQ